MLSVGKEVVVVAFVRPQSRGGAGKREEGKASHDSLFQETVDVSSSSFPNAVTMYIPSHTQHRPVDPP